MLASFFQNTASCRTHNIRCVTEVMSKQLPRSLIFRFISL